MKKILTYTISAITIVGIIILIALYSFNLGKTKEYERLNNKYVFSCLESSNQDLSQDEKKDCFAKMYKNKLWSMQNLFTINLAIEHLDGNFLSSLSNEKYMKEIYPILLDKCFKNLDNQCITDKLILYDENKKDDVNKFFNDLNYILINNPEYKFTAGSFINTSLMNMLRVNVEICNEIQYKDIIHKLKNNKSILNMDFSRDNTMKSPSLTYYGECVKDIYGLKK